MGNDFAEGWVASLSIMWAKALAVFIFAAAIGTILGSPSRAAEIWPSLEVCVKNLIPSLDDGISSADVIAAGVALKCREVLARNCKCDGERLQNALAIVKTETLPYVLEYRASKRAPR